MQINEQQLIEKTNPLFAMKHIERLYPFAVFNKGACVSSREMTLSDMKAIAVIIDKYKPKTVLEIGAWTGSVTCLLGMYLKEVGGKLYTIDSFEGSPGSYQVGENAKKAKERFFDNIDNFGIKETVTFLSGNSDDFKDLDVEFDLVFIDADHRYSQTKKDLDNFYPKVREGGVIAGHDFNSVDYDERYIEDDFVDGVHHGVTKAVKEKFGKVTLFMDNTRNKLSSSVWLKEKLDGDKRTTAH